MTAALSDAAVTVVTTCKYGEWCPLMCTLIIFLCFALSNLISPGSADAIVPRCDVSLGYTITVSSVALQGFLNVKHLLAAGC